MNNVNNIISLESYDKNSGIFYFRFLLNENGLIKYRISCHDLTAYKTEHLIEPNSDVVYYVGINSSFVEYVDNLKLTVEFGNKIQIIEVENRDRDIKLTDIYKFNVDTEDESFFTYCEVFDKEVYNNKTVKVEKGDLVVDIGANFGFFTKYAHLKGAKKIYCFEPSFKTFKYLQKNFEDYDDVFLNNCAVSNYTGLVHFIDSQNSAASRISNEGYEVNAKSINDILSYEITSHIDYLKVDCEGSEKEIFESVSSENLKKVKKIAVEYHSEEIKKNILSRLISEGFTIDDISNQIIFAYRKNEIVKVPKKKVALISSFCDTEKKIQILKENLRILKNLQIDTMVIIPNFLPVDEEVVKLSDFVFYTKENPLLEYPTRQYSHWYELQLSNGRVTTLHRGFADYGWAALYQTKKLSQLALTFDYDLFYHMIYDLEIDDVVIDELSGNNCNVVHPRRNPNHPEEIWETTLHFMVFDREMLETIEKEITLEEYLSTNGVAEGEVLKWTKKYPLKISEYCIKDKVFYWEGFDFFNVSPYSEFKMFISKNPELTIWLGYNNPYSETLCSNLRIVFYGIPEDFVIQIIVDGTKFDLKPKNWEYVELPIDSQKIHNISFNYNGIVKDFTKEYSKINLNQIFYNFRS